MIKIGVLVLVLVSQDSLFLLCFYACHELMMNYNRFGSL
jgi:hypothetical protein